jgi:hypothetical protein
MTLQKQTRTPQSARRSRHSTGSISTLSSGRGGHHATTNVRHAPFKPAKTLADLAQRHREAHHSIEGNFLSSIANGLLSVRDASWIAESYMDCKKQQGNVNWYSDSMSLLHELRQVVRFQNEGLEKEQLARLVSCLLQSIKQVS